MPSRRDQPPAPAELLAWLAVPAPPFASGVFLSETDTVAFGYVSSGEPPVLVTVPSHRPVVFAHEAPDRWRLEVDGALLAMSDGNSAVGVALRQSEAPGEVLHVGRELRLVNGPDVLLRPEPPALLHDVEQWHRDPRDERAQLAVGDVVADEVLGRACWRWSSPYGTWWLDTQTGVLLRVVTPSGSARFLELDVLQPPASDRFVIAVDVLSRAVPVPDPFEERHHEAGAVSPISLGLTLDVFPDSAGEAEHADRPGSDDEVATAQPGPRPGAALRGAPTGDTGFTVCWWPEPADSQLVWGDPDVPAVLVQLEASGPGTRFWLGVAPSGHEAPALDPEDDDVQVHRWEGDGWTYALSWQDTISRADLDRLVASVPRSWT